MASNSQGNSAAGSSNDQGGSALNGASNPNGSSGQDGAAKQVKKSAARKHVGV